MFGKSISAYIVLGMMTFLLLYRIPAPPVPPPTPDRTAATPTRPPSYIQKSAAQSAAYGPLRFSDYTTEGDFSLSLDNRFLTGTHEITARIFYTNPRPGETWRADWSYEGIIIKSERGNWGKSSNEYIDFTFRDEAGLKTGTYTLTISAGNQILRRSTFWVVKKNIDLSEPSGKKPLIPEDMIDEDLIPAWDLLNESDDESIHDLAQLVLTRRIPILLNRDTDTIASYRYSCTNPPKVGKILVNVDDREGLIVTELAGPIAHEITRAVWHLDEGVCGCTKEMEFYAAVSEIAVYIENGGKDLVEENYPGVFDKNGDFSQELLWDTVDEFYSECTDN